jgi:hypothetical protein
MEYSWSKGATRRDPENKYEYMVSKLTRPEIVMALVKLRIEKFATTKTMMDFLKSKPFNYKESYSYELIREAKQKIIEIYKEDCDQSYEAYKARLEEMVETTKSERIRLEAIKELNKLTGSYRPNKVDITTNGNDLTFNEVVIKIVTTDKDED